MNFLKTVQKKDKGDYVRAIDSHECCFFAFSMFFECSLHPLENVNARALFAGCVHVCMEYLVGIDDPGCICKWVM